MIQCALCQTTFDENSAKKYLGISSTDENLHPDVAEYMSNKVSCPQCSHWVDLTKVSDQSAAANGAAEAKEGQKQRVLGDLTQHAPNPAALNPPRGVLPKSESATNGKARSNDNPKSQVHSEVTAGGHGASDRANGVQPGEQAQGPSDMDPRAPVMHFPGTISQVKRLINDAMRTTIKKEEDPNPPDPDEDFEVLA